MAGSLCGFGQARKDQTSRPSPCCSTVVPPPLLGAAAPPGPCEPWRLLLSLSVCSVHTWGGKSWLSAEAKGCSEKEGRNWPVGQTGLLLWNTVMPSEKSVYKMVGRKNGRFHQLQEGSPYS